MPDHRIYHPHPPGPKADAGDRLIFRLDAQLTQLENSRRHGINTIDRDMDSVALAWQRTHAEFLATMDAERRRAART